MGNMVFLIGRLSKPIKGNRITLAVSRAYKNKEGIYETDFVECELFGRIAEHTAEYCKKGDLIGIKGRLATGNKIIVDKISFLASRKK